MRGSGKSTIVKETVDKLVSLGIDAEAWKAKRTEEPVPVYEAMMRSIKEFDLESKKTFVLDRFHLTEYVMSTYLGRVPLADLLMTTKLLDYHLTSRRATCIILDANYDTIDSRMSIRDDIRKLDMPVMMAKNLWEEAQALSRIAVTRTNNTEAEKFETINFAVSRVMEQLSDMRREDAV